MNWLRRKYYLLKLKGRAYVLQAQADDGAETIQNFQERHRLVLAELSQVKRRIMAAEEPEVLLRKAA